MTVTVEILNLTGDTEIADVDIKSINPSDWALVDRLSDKQNLISETTHRFTQGEDPRYPGTLRVGRYVSPPKAGSPVGRTNVSVKFTTYVRYTDDVAGIVWIEPFDVVLATSAPDLSGVPEAADYLVALQNTFSVYAQGATDGDLDATEVSKLQFGVTDLLS